MGLFDFIKKNPSVDTSRLPEFENYGQSPESFSNFQFSRSFPTNGKLQIEVEGTKYKCNHLFV